MNEYQELIKSMKIKSKKELPSNQGKYLNKKVYQVTLNNGKTFIYERITKNNRQGNAVVIIPELSNNKFLMILETRPNTLEEVVLEYPAGMIDEGEQAIDAAKRELLEETGYIAQNFELLEWHYQDQGCSQARIYTYLATNLKKVSNNYGVDDDENIRPITITLEETSNLIATEKIVDANSKIAYLTLNLKKRGNNYE